MAALLLAGAKGGYPAERPRLLSGAAWLTSSQLGQVTLLDGSSAEVAAQVQVGARAIASTWYSTAPNFTAVFVPGLGAGNFPGFFTGCVRNDTASPVAYTEFVGPGPF